MSEARTRLDENGNVIPSTTFSDIIAEFDHVDDPDVLERMKTTPGLDCPNPPLFHEMVSRQ